LRHKLSDDLVQALPGVPVEAKGVPLDNLLTRFVAHGSASFQCPVKGRIKINTRERIFKP